MKIVVTGSEGFIGKHLSQYVSKTHTVYNYDIVAGEDYNLSTELVTQNMPDCDAIVHLAATNGTRLFYEYPTDVLINNTLPTINLLKRYRKTNAKFVFASTCEIFNGAIDLGVYPVPTDENVPAVFNNITNPRWSYSLPKALGENLIANSGLEYLIIRYFNVYGPGQKDHFINEFVDRVKNGKYYINGNDTRSFCYIDDAVTMTSLLIEREKNLTVNIGKQEEIKISEVAKLIMEIMGVCPDRLEINPSPAGSVTRRCPDTTLIKSLTNFENYTPLKDGLEKTIESLL